MSRTLSSRVPRTRLVLALGALVVALGASRAPADPTATISVFGASGAGEDHHDDHVGSGFNALTANTRGAYARIFGNPWTGGTNPDVNLHAKASSKTSYAVQVQNCDGWSVYWTATGVMNWHGAASVRTELDADATSKGIAALVYSGDLQLTGGASVCATTGSDTETTWEISLTPKIGQKSSHRVGTGDDSVSAGDSTQNCGSSTKFAVQVRSYAEGSVLLDTNCIGMGRASSQLEAENVGQIQVVFVCAPPTAKGLLDPNDGRTRVYACCFVSDEGPQVLGDSDPMIVSDSVPENPPTFDDPVPFEGVDAGGDVWTSEEIPDGE